MIRPSEYLTTQEVFWLRLENDSLRAKIVPNKLLDPVVPQQKMYFGMNEYHQLEVACTCDLFLRKKICQHILDAYKSQLEVPITSRQVNVLIYKNPWLAVPVVLESLDANFDRIYSGYIRLYKHDRHDKKTSIGIVHCPTTWMELRNVILDWLPSLELSPEVNRCSSEIHKVGTLPPEDSRMRNQYFFNIFDTSICPDCDLLTHFQS